jgi:hypothetical protein
MQGVGHKTKLREDWQWQVAVDGTSKQWREMFTFKKKNY